VLAAAGYVVLRYTWRRISEEPEKVVGELRAVLAARGGQE
jgi:very-short-patch-repair endonuclease